ncbi:MAG: thioredoxin [Bryobacteraceae bacterium]|jgi:thioredoxin 1
MLLFRSLVFLALASGTLAAAPWRLVLKDGRILVCDAPPIVIDGSYLFREIDGKDGNLPASEIDEEKTARANRTDFQPRWREIGRTEQPLHPEEQEPAGDGRILTFGDSNFGAEVLRSRVPVLVDFWATWCGPCRRIAPTVDAIAARYAGRIKVGKVDGDRNDATAERYRIDGYPTLLLFKNGAVVGKIEGVAGRDEIARMIDAHL